MKTFKAEKEILEEFFKNKKINEICDGLPLREEVYNIHYYTGEIKNPQKLNVKNSFDLLKYLKPCFVYIASDIKTIKEEIKKEHADDLTMYQNYFFYISINLPNINTYYYCHRLFVGFEDCIFKKNHFQRFFKWK